ncbi:MAG: DNA polymerase [Candidatus Marinimicrobia bacterium]|nr:DNA polymerase [Candidatus Neomarinimicrobiota bacterium]
MPAKGIYLPNIRNQFIPDPGMLMFDADLSGADAQVVAWEADDEGMKKGFREGMKIHVKNTRDRFPDEWGDATTEEIKQDHIYKAVKTICHATNYGGTAPSLAANPILRWPISKVEDFQSRWFMLHPGILEWHNRTTRFLEGDQCWNCLHDSTGGVICKSCKSALGRTVRNAFGYRRIYFERTDRLLPEALAWVPQSTVAIVTQRGLILLAKQFPRAQILLQVHDSLVGQIPKGEHRMLEDIQGELDQIVVPYPDPLRIPWGIAVSEEHWGACK